MSDRQALHAYLSDKAHAAWGVFSEENGVSVTGLLEALGLELADELEQADADTIRRDWIRRGRKIDAFRRRRGPR